MFNTLKADFYRLFRTKSFYITQIILVLLVFVTVFSQAVGTIGMQTDDLTQFQTEISNVEWTGAFSIQVMSTMSSFLLYFTLPLLSLILGYDLIHGTQKNLLTSGVSRANFFFSKYLIFVIISACELLFYYGVTFLTATAANGVGEFEADFLTNFSRALAIEMLCIQAIFSFAILVLYLLFSNVAAVITVIVFPLAIMICRYRLFTNSSFLKYLDLQTNLDSAWFLVPEAPNYWMQVALACLLCIFSSLAISYQIFKRKSL